MTLVQQWCSAANPADGTALGAPAGFANPVTGSGTTRTWRTADAWRANTGVDFITGGGTDALRTTAFTGNATLAFTGVLRTPSVNPSASLTVLTPRTSAGVGFRFQWTASGAFVILNTAGAAIVVPGAAAGALANNTRYLVQTWFKQVAASASGTMKLVIYDLAGTLIGSYDSDTNGLVNLGSNPFVQLDLDQGGVASNYGWSEIQYDDGRASFIPAWTPGTAYSGTLTVGGAGTVTAASTASTASTIGLSGDGTLAGTAAIATSQALPLSGSGTSETSGTPRIGSTIGLTAAGVLTPEGAAAARAMLATSASGSAAFSARPTLRDRLDLAALGQLDQAGRPSLADRVAQAGQASAAFTGRPATADRVSLVGVGYVDLVGVASFPQLDLTPRRVAPTLPGRRAGVHVRTSDPITVRVP